MSNQTCQIPLCMVDDCRLRTDRRNGHGLRSEKGSKKRRLTRQQVQRDAAVLAFYVLMPTTLVGSVRASACVPPRRRPVAGGGGGVFWGPVPPMLREGKPKKNKAPGGKRRGLAVLCRLPASIVGRFGVGALHCCCCCCWRLTAEHGGHPATALGQSLRLLRNLGLLELGQTWHLIRRELRYRVQDGCLGHVLEIAL